MIFFFFQKAKASAFLLCMLSGPENQDHVIIKLDAGRKNMCRGGEQGITSNL